jgi:hypothetical protein
MDDIDILDYYRDEIADLEHVCVLEDGTEIDFFDYIAYLLSKFPYRDKIVGYDKVFDGKENRLIVEDIKNMIKLGLLKDDLNLVNNGN